MDSFDGNQHSNDETGHDWSENADQPFPNGSVDKPSDDELMSNFWTSSHVVERDNDLTYFRDSTRSFHDHYNTKGRN